MKTVINRRYHLNKSFEEILNLLDIWINEGSGWVIDQIEGLYINVANYETLLGGSYILLPRALNNSMKGLINLKNKDHKCFMWCHVRLINPQNRKAERINKQDKKIAANLSYSDIVFPVDIEIYADTECFLKRTNSYEGEHTIKYQEHRPNSIGAKLICIDD